MHRKAPILKRLQKPQTTPLMLSEMILASVDREIDHMYVSTEMCWAR